MKDMKAKKVFGLPVGCLLLASISAHALQAEPLLVSDGGCSVLSIDELGRIASLREKSSGRELVRQAEPMFAAKFSDGKVEVPRAATRRADGRLVYSGFGSREGEVVLSCEKFDGGWTFKIESVTLKGLSSIACGQVSPTCLTYCGKLVNGFSDATDGVVLRGYGYRAKMSAAGSRLSVAYLADAPIAGEKFGLAAARRADMPKALRAMTLAAGIPHSSTGGGWSLGAEGNRSSYYMLSNPTEDTVEDWIDFALRCGSTTLHFDWWWEPHKAEGHYEVWTNRFPHGLAGLREASRKAHAAGLKTDTHTLSGCIGFNDSWVTPHASSNLMYKYTYTLARDMGKDDDVVYVNEPPGRDHHYELLYNSNGNVLRIGTELMQYSEVVPEKPYRFTGVKRGSFKTEVMPHAAGERTDYVWQHYLSFFADPDSPLSEELAGNLAGIYATCGFDQVYMDGAEGVANATYPPDERKRDRQLLQFFTSFAASGNPPLWEASTWTTQGWWFHSRIGSWDYPHVGPRSFVDRHMRYLLPQSRLENYLEPSLGWWHIAGGGSFLGDALRGFYLDEHEYFVGKTAAADAAISLRHHWSNVALEPFEIGIMQRMTLIGWYERFRLARAMNENLKRALSVPGSEFRVRQDARGEWRAEARSRHEHRVIGSGETAVWRPELSAGGKASLRVAALHGIAPYDDPAGVHAFGADDLGSFVKTCASNVTLRAMAVQGEKGASVVLDARNSGPSPRGAWAAVSAVYRYPYTNRVFKGCNAYGFWVKGDGSGAVMNVQTKTAAEDGLGFNDHIVKLDFNGWRYVSFAWNRESDAEQFDKYVWPYANYPQAYAVYSASLIRNSRIGGIAVYLNEVPAGKRTSVEISEIRALPVREETYEDVAMTVNGREVRLPFPLRTMEYAEREDGFWTRYSGYSCDPIERIPAADDLSLSAGRQEISVSGHGRSGAPMRAELTLFVAGDSMPALVPKLTKEQEGVLAYEAAMPQLWAPSKGFDKLDPIVVRPGHTAKMELELVGPVAYPTVVVGTTRRRFNAIVTATEKLVVKDGRNWFVRGPCGKVRLRGTLGSPLPRLSGNVPLSIESSKPWSDSAQVRVLKRYDVK